jgi:hypothetical protein
MPNEQRKKKESPRGDAKLVIGGVIQLSPASYEIKEMRLISGGKGKNFLSLKIMASCIRKKHRDVMKREAKSYTATKNEIKQLLDQKERKKQLATLFKEDQTRNPFIEIEHEFELIISSSSFLLSDTIPHQEADYLNISKSIAAESLDIESIYTFNIKRNNVYINNNHAKDGIRTNSAKQPGIYALLYSRKYNEIFWMPCALLDMSSYMPF